MLALRYSFPDNRPVPTIIPTPSLRVRASEEWDQTEAERR
jgi:hypothetical protein